MCIFKIPIVCGALLLALVSHAEEVGTRYDHAARVAQVNADYAEAKEMAKQMAKEGANKHANDDLVNAQYRAALEKCSGLASHAKARCIANTKAWFDKN